MITADDLRPSYRMLIDRNHRMDLPLNPYFVINSMLPVYNFSMYILFQHYGLIIKIYALKWNELRRLSGEIPVYLPK